MLDEESDLILYCIRGQNSITPSILFMKYTIILTFGLFSFTTIYVSYTLFFKAETLC